MAEKAKFFVDTSILIAHIRNSHPNILSLASSYFGTVVVSDVVVFELEVGAQKSGRSLEFATKFPLIETYPITQEIWLLCAKIQAQLLKQNQAIGLTDTLIAVSSIYYDYPLLTLNNKHFQRIPQVKLLAMP